MRTLISKTSLAFGRPDALPLDKLVHDRRARPVLWMIVAAGLLAVSLSPTGRAENWPQWRGPHLNGTAQVKNLPVEWSESKNVQWKTAMPSWSGATPIVWNDRIFVMSPSEESSQPSPPAAADQAGNESAPQRGFRRGGGQGGGRGGGMDSGGQQLLLLCLNRADGSVA